ncbi:hypothetical protein NL676_014491 [Syzygium grande]|nr:hypothetical protein NL676_014491 [Syzygium grande]
MQKQTSAASLLSSEYRNSVALHISVAMEVVPTKTHIALLASPGMGHLIPVLELGRRFAVHHRFLVTIFVVTTDASAAQSQLPHYSSYQDLLDIVFLPPVDISHLVTDSMSIVSLLVLIMRHAMPILRAEVTRLKPSPSALVVDLLVPRLSR